MTPLPPSDQNPPEALKLRAGPRPFTCVNDRSKSPTAPLGPTPAIPATPTAPAHSVEAVLHDQLARDTARGLYDVDLTAPRSNRRAKDYWVMLLLGNALIAAGMAVGGFNTVSVVYGGSGVVIYSLGLSWIVWVVMDRY